MQLLYMLGGCATHVYVYDFTTKEPIPDAFVYVNEYKMFNPFNSSNIYLTDKDGCVDISETLRDGQVSIYIGKDGYPLNIFSRDFEGKENIKVVEGILIEAYRRKYGHFPPWNNMGGSVVGQKRVMPNNINIVKSFCSPDDYYINPIVSRSTIRELSQKEMADLANQAINCTTMEEVVELVEKVIKK